MLVSAILLTWNESEMIQNCLKYLDSLKGIDEVIVFDSISSDDTASLALKWPKVKLWFHDFEHWSLQGNRAMDKAKNDWVLRIDADETFSQGLDELLLNLPTDKNLIGVPDIITKGDSKHYIDEQIGFVHVLWKKSVYRYQPPPSLFLTDKVGNCPGKNWSLPGMMSTIGLYPNIIRKHHQNLRSDKRLIEKGIRLKEIGVLDKEGYETFGMKEDHWLNGKNNQVKVLELPKNWYDITTGEL